MCVKFTFVKIITVLLLLVCASAFANARGKFLNERDSIIILSSPSMTQALAEISREYAKEKGVTISLYFAESDELSEMIELGDGADVIITDDFEDIQKLKQMGLVASDLQKKVASSELVLVSSKNSKISAIRRQLSKLGDNAEILKIITSKSFIVTPDTNESNMGRIIRQELENLGVWKQCRKQLIQAATSAEATYLTAKGAHVGIVSEADINGNEDVDLISNLDQYIDFYASAVAGSKMTLARDFISYLSEGGSLEILQKRDLY